MSDPLAKYIIVGMSGGVDSSVTAYLLKKAGHHVEAIFMKNWHDEDTDIYCPAAQDIADARSICEKLAIDLQIVNFADEYWQNVFSYFLQSYSKALTPNPDVLCNKEIKFKVFLEYAKKKGADYIATGHYARILTCKDTFYLAKGRDAQKDQSYFLYLLNQHQLKHSLFPLGEMSKESVRQLACDLDFVNYAKKDSTGICFIGERKFRTFLQQYLPTNPGEIETLDGEIIGQHDGLMYYTIGQRQGLQIGGKKNKSDAAWYVAAKNLERNVLTVVQGNDHPALFKKIFTRC